MLIIQEWKIHILFDFLNNLESLFESRNLDYTVTYQKYLHRPKFPLIFLRIYLLIIESTH